MEPRIRYAQTKDGVSIAYSTLGDGMPILYMGFPLFSHLQFEWGIPELRAFYETIAQDRTLVRYDYRSTGLSDRTVKDMSLDSLVLDLEAVADRLRLERFALFTSGRMGPVGITYTVRQLERISHLILWNAVASASDYSPTRQIQASLTLAEQDWELFTETYVHLLGGWAGGEGARRAAALAREAITPEGFRALETAFRDFDVTKLLPKVACPTLVLHHRENPLTSTGAATRLASNIPDARLVLLEGQSLSPHRYIDDIVATFDEFLGEGEEAAAKAGPPEAGAFRTVLFTDVEGSTALTQRLGDARARDLLREHERMVREALKAHGGAEVKTMGDGFMVSFSSATRALECAIAMQRAFAHHNESAKEPIRVRIGLNAGEPIAEEDDLFGTAVIVAARIAAQATGGEILASNVIRELTAGKDFLYADRGDVALRGFEDPVRLYEVRWRKA